MNQHFFIAGTDTGVGKTYVVTELLRSLHAAGINAVGFKPITCGDRAEVRSMREIIGQPNLSLDSVNPVYLRTATDPLMAAFLEHKEVDVDCLYDSWQKLTEQFDVVLTEGIYGWLTPIAPGVTAADFAKKLNLPIILVTDNRKGAAGQVAMVAESIAEMGLNCVGVILNHPGEEWDTAAVTNADLIERTTGLPILASLIQNDLVDAEILNV
ncbi:MAG: dethiobiotin synthase [Akkermansiaceae bacterium]|nr:dethiobiotin synthase [Akkermansiaceae bacterium]